jgi:hypothetical protein
VTAATTTTARRNMLWRVLGVYDVTFGNELFVVWGIKK